MCLLILSGRVEGWCVFSSMPPAEKILVVGPAWVGDMVIAQSLFAVLARAGGEVDVLAPRWSLPLLARMPQVARAIEMPLGHGELRIGVRRALGRRLRGDGYARAIVLPGSYKSALVPWFAKIARRSGYVGEQRWGVLNDIRRLDKRALPRNVERFVALGVARDAQLPTIPNPVLRADARQAVGTAARFGLADDAPIIALCPGAEYGDAKQWPGEHFAEVARRQRQLGRQVWLLGSPNDRAIAARIVQLSGDACVDLCGKTTLDEAVDLLSLAHGVVTNDSGLMHIAAALGRRVIALFGSSSDAFTPPLGAQCETLSLRLACSPCFRRQCPLGHRNCLVNLSPQRVLPLLE